MCEAMAQDESGISEWAQSGRNIEARLLSMNMPGSGEGVLFADHTTGDVGGPRFKHDAEVSLEPSATQDHYLGTRLDRSGDPVDLYIRLSKEGGEGELVARFGDDVDNYMTDSLVRIFSMGAEWANVMAGVERTYGIRMAFDAALGAGYDLAQVAADLTARAAEVAREDQFEIG